MKRVVVTGIGSVGPLGSSFGESWKALKAGGSGISRITRFDPSALPWKIAGELKAFDGTGYLSQKEIARLDPFVHYAVAAAAMAVEDSGLAKKSKSKGQKSKVKDQLYFAFPIEYLTSSGVIIGSSRGGITSIENALLRTQNQILKTRNRRFSPYLMPSTTVSMASSCVAQKMGINGHCLGISNACASGTNAVGEAFRIIKSGYSSLVLAGGSEAPICRLSVEGYGIAGALSKKTTGTPSPFDNERDGFVLSEGACLLLLEEYEQALKRGAGIYGEILGYGNTSDAFHMTQPDPEGEAEAIRRALKESGFGPSEVDYVNTHGTGTRIGDFSEAQAIRKVFGKRSSAIPASAIKSMTGHMLAASGAFEIASTLMSMKTGIIPPTINLDKKDPECDINIITKSKRMDINIAISNSFGFGGVNAVIALRKV
ncbi:MAG TPA: beta-ketoacyl-[acyl-carrier-protein] synthase family protein [Thermodesulfovibrionales bacterium]|nr:beta-ketoacyl-[acyl-carrier-protein] synthase family protein [Thermodesulfovibrionales bacterium]